MAADHLFLIHIIGTHSDSAGKSVAEAQLEEVGDPQLWGWGDRW
jgi:hypothetical protein